MNESSRFSIQVSHQKKARQFMERIVRTNLTALVMTLLLHALSLSQQCIPPSAPEIQYGGRWEKSDKHQYRYSWPGVYLTAGFTGTSVGVRLTDCTNYYNVYIDGALHSVFHPTRKQEADYVLAEGLTAGNHTLTLSRRNITFGEIYSFGGILLDSGAALLPAAPPPQRKIEFIGDSYTAAESNESTEQSLDWEARYPVTNIDKGFATIIARHFNAQYTTTCRSGSGIVCDWQGNMAESIPDRFNRVFMDSREPVWDFHQWIPNVVVIALGLNDHSGLKDKNGKVSAKRSALFRYHYRKFLATIRSVYPGVKIVCVAAFPPWIRRQTHLIVDAETRSGAKDCYYAQYDEFPGGYVGNGHPTVATHKLMADQIIAAMESFKLFRDGK
jgi:hypothetical protein